MFLLRLGWWSVGFLADFRASAVALAVGIAPVDAAPDATHPSRSCRFGAFGFGGGLGLYPSHVAASARLLRSLVGLLHFCHCGHHFVFLALWHGWSEFQV